MFNKKNITRKNIMYGLAVVFILLLLWFLSTLAPGLKDISETNTQKSNIPKQKATDIKKADFNSLFAHAVKLQKHSDYEKAIAQYQMAIAQDPQSALADNAYYNIVEILDSPELKRYGEAVAICRKILKDYPESEVADNAQYYIAKTIHITDKNPLDSIDEYKKFLEMFPDSKYAVEAQNVLDYFNSDPDGDGFTQAEAIYREMMDEMVEETHAVAEN